jgi:hypothetical protein
MEERHTFFHSQQNTSVFGVWRAITGKSAVGPARQASTSALALGHVGGLNVAAGTWGYMGVFAGAPVCGAQARDTRLVATR